VKFTGSRSVAVHQAEGVTLLSPSRAIAELISKREITRTTSISSDFTPIIDGNLVRIGSGTIIETYTAFVNGGEEFPATYLSATRIQAVTFPNGPTSGFIYLEVMMDPPDGPDATNPPGLSQYFEMDVGGDAYGVNAFCGSSYGRISGDSTLRVPFVFYEAKPPASSVYFRRLLASVTLNGSGTPLSVQQLHFGDIFIPQPTNVLFGLTINIL